MIRYEDHMIGDYVLVNGKIRRIEAITKKKIGFHTNEDKKGLSYARLCEVFPIEIKELKLETKSSQLIANEGLYIEADIEKLSICDWNHTIMLQNYFGECLILREWHLHLLQHIFKTLDIKYTINIKK